MIIFKSSGDSILVQTKNARKSLGEIYQEVDGFYVYDASNYPGYWNEYFLETLLNKLKELNEPIKKELEQFFEDRK